jgi:hypothetical protein
MRQGIAKMLFLFLFHYRPIKNFLFPLFFLLDAKEPKGQKETLPDGKAGTYNTFLSSI